MAMENITREPIPREPVREERMGMVASAGTSVIQGVVGIAAIALAIIALAGIFPEWLVAIAVILLGVGFLLEAGSVGARYYSLLSEPGAAPREGAFGFFGGSLTMDFLGGIAGIVLGILALLNIYPMLLVSIAAIVFGATLVLGMGTISSLNALSINRACKGYEAQNIAHSAMRSAESLQLLIGLGSIVLGLLAIVGFIPVTLTLIAVLGVGFSELFSGSAVGARMLSALHCA